VPNAPNTAINSAEVEEAIEKVVIACTADPQKLFQGTNHRKVQKRVCLQARPLPSISQESNMHMVRYIHVEPLKKEAM